MISSRRRAVTAQSSLEACLVLALVFSLALGGAGLLLGRIATLILIKWAAFHSRCLAQGKSPSSCQALLSPQLENWFRFKEVSIRSWEKRGTIHSEISAVLLWPARGSYDLSPGEYKRVMP